MPWRPDDALARLSALRADPRWADRPDLVAAAATQAELRTRARTRFPGPSRWWTRSGLEQATRPVVAQRHAAKIVAAGCRRVVDLGCGAGSDALAMAAAGLAVLAVDLDQQALAALRATAVDLDLGNLRVQAGDVHEVVRDLPPDPDTALFVDPARRERSGTRRMHPQAWSPKWSWVVGLAERYPVVGAKVAPGIPHELIPDGAQAEWVSVGGELLEAGIWWGPLAAPGPARRIATVLPEAGAGKPAALDDGLGVPDAAVGPAGTWLLEPDPAVIRAGLVALLADQLGGRLLHPQIAYITGDGPLPSSALGTSFEVEAEVPFARKAMRRWLMARGIGNVVIKKRGLELDPVVLRRALRLPGGGPEQILVLTRTAAGPLALAVRRP